MEVFEIVDIIESLTIKKSKKEEILDILNEIESEDEKENILSLLDDLQFEIENLEIEEETKFLILDKIEELREELES